MGSTNLRGDTDAMVLMIGELVTNAVAHGGLEDDERIHLDVKDLGSRLRVEVRHAGRRAAEALQGWERGQRPRASAEPWESGHGLRIVAALADRAGIDHRGAWTVAWFEVDSEAATMAHAASVATPAAGARPR
jgi:anti-sigma regulatory factor (Ser/Thr protein kinase)